MSTLIRIFLVPVALSFLALGFVFHYLGLTALLTATLLIVLEITLSFDNAVVNVKVLSQMNERWQKRFLTWGIFIAVFGTRIFLPILIVSIVTWASPLFITWLAFFNPIEYGELLHRSSSAIHAFGGVFLLLVALNYFLDNTKKVHWIHSIEKHLMGWGRVESLELLLSLIALVAVSFFVAPSAQSTVLVAGIVGLGVFVGMQMITSAVSVDAKSGVSQSLALFLYLEILDSSFSLDGVVGAFALTSSIPVIAVGLGIGAYFVRSLTIFMVRKRTLDTLIFLEHGAHWAIFGLATIMFVSLLTEVPEVITGTIGLAFIAASYYSSLKFNKRRQ